MTLRTAAAALGVVALSGLLSAQQPAKTKVGPPPPTYLANADARLQEALASAGKENRRVLIQWGTNGDAVSDALIRTMTKGPEVPRTLLYEYEVVRAELKGNEQLAAKYDVKGPVPQLTVLDARGTLLANQPVAPFKAAGDDPAAFDAKKLTEFLKKHQASYLAAEPLFTRALLEAKKDQKTLFLWFSAPW